VERKSGGCQGGLPLLDDLLFSTEGATTAAKLTAGIPFSSENIAMCLTTLGHQMRKITSRR
jgi:hypothetical protein